MEEKAPVIKPGSTLDLVVATLIVVAMLAFVVAFFAFAITHGDPTVRMLP